MTTDGDGARAKRTASKAKRTSKEQRAMLRAELYTRIEQGDLDLRTALRMMRKIAGRSQADYARLVGVSPRVLIEFERGIGNPTLKTVEKMLVPFGLVLTLRRRSSSALPPPPGSA
jgi:DNA-binding XRE family transcriptional regulator